MAYSSRDVTAQWAWHGVSGLPEDDFVNTFAFRMPLLPADEDFGDVTGAIGAFYVNVAPGALVSLLSWYSKELSRAWTCKFYRLTDPAPRAVVYSASGTAAVGSTGVDRAPAEVALCASFKAADASGQVPSRRRGRIYLGPFAKDAINGLTGRPNGTLTSDAKFASQKLKEDIDAIAPGDHTWCVHSRTNLALYDITSGWVDDAFDTQRRRGNRPTGRDPWPIL